ncbi:hypothetical protein [Coleofasciculus sp. FACHB-T130]|uniref:hypothetical protein n=1 Tax=Cyanophyceae TaxID=3028117 RepID=UPI0018F00B5C|nr:hypothetical protein [Coleofasciculus sp. FACHB-T130]
MEYWQFLIQQEGDSSWLSLETPSVEIQEGRYRVVAHSSRPNTEVEIRITYDSTEEVPPKRRFQKRSRRTNAEGLMVVIPFTYLKSGRWELRCSGDIMSDFLGNTWQQAIQFQVFPTTPADADVDLVGHMRPVWSAQVGVATETVQESSAGSAADRPVNPAPTTTETLTADVDLPNPVPPSPEDESVTEAMTNAGWEEDDDEAVNELFLSFGASESQRWETALNRTPPKAAVPVSRLVEHSLQMVDEILQEVVDPVWQAFEPTSTARGAIPQSEFSRDSLTSPPVSNSSELSFAAAGRSYSAETEPPEIDEAPIRLTLDRETLVVRRGELIAFSGQVEILDSFRDLHLLPPDVLRIEMRDPQNSQILVDVQQLIPEQVPSFSFSCNLELPENCQTRLILGEVTLIDEAQTVLVTHSFTVTADLEDLLDAIAHDKQHANLLNPPLDSLLGETPPIDSSFLDLVETAKDTPPLHLEPLPNKPLPEQIAKSDPAIAALKPPELPAIASDTEATGNGEATDSDEPEDILALGDRNTSVTSEPPPVVSLPPQLYRPDPANPVNRSLKLPVISDAMPATERIENGDTSAAKEEDLSSALNPPQPVDAAPPEGAAPDVEQLFDNLLNHLAQTWQRPEEPDGTDASADADTDLHSQQDVGVEDASDIEGAQHSAEHSAEQREAHPSADSQASPLDTAFATLKLQDRFLSRLNDLATDEESSAWLQPEEVLATEEESTEEAEPSADLTEGSEDTDVADGDVADGDVADGTEATAAEPQGETDDRLPPMPTDWELVALLLDQQPPLPELEEELGEDGGIASDATNNSQEVGAASGQLPATPQNPVEMAKNVLSMAESAVNWTEREIVVDDDPSELPPSTSGRGGYGSREASSRGVQPGRSRFANAGRGVPPEPQPSSLDEEPVPEPELVLPEGELIAGQPLAVRLTLRSESPRLYVKLWVHDRQTRSLLDGPRWLVDFIPTGLESLEATTQLTVPFGSVEIRFEAVTVDTYTQRESHKVTVDRIVIPPDLPNWSLDEFAD